jgi:hypothetical protein
MNHWGFDVANTPVETPAQNLTAGTYKLLVESVEFGMKPQGQQYRTIANAAEGGADLIIQVKCLLTEDSGAFKSGWKHNMFFRPMKDGDAGKIARSQFKQLLVACGCEAAQSNDALIGKQFILELVQQKNNPEYTNIKSIKALDCVAETSNPAPAQVAPAAAPAQAMPLGSQAPATTPSWD